MQIYKRYLLFSLCFAVLFSCSLGIGMQIAKKQSAAAACYAVLYPYEGYIGVFANTSDYHNGSIPLDIIRTEIDMLPDADKLALQDGIILESRETLWRYIEDFEIGISFCPTFEKPILSWIYYSTSLSR